MVAVESVIVFKRALDHHLRNVRRHSVLDLSGGLEGLTPLWCLSTPKFVLTPEKIVKKSQKYIADPPLVLPQIVYWGHL